MSVGGFLLTRATVDAAAASGAVVVDMSDFLFEPQDVTVGAGEQLLFTNSDAFAHDFTLDEYDLYTYFGPGSEALVDVSALPPGPYTYFCSLHTFDGEGMTGYFDDRRLRAQSSLQRITLSHVARSTAAPQTARGGLKPQVTAF